MALERLYSRAAALRNRYSLSTGPFPPGGLPPRLRPYYSGDFRVELRTLYEEGEESRRQFLFIDPGGRTRLLAVLENPAGEEGGGGGAGTGNAGPPGFIEAFDENHLLTESRQIMESGLEYVSRYSYRNGVLVRAETGVKGEPSAAGAGADTAGAAAPGPAAERPVSTDYYRYTRAGALRMVERVFHRKAGEAGEAEASGEDTRTQFRFPRMSPDSPVNPGFVQPSAAYSSEFLRDVFQDDAFRVLYTTDGRGRVIAESRQDEAGKVLGEVRNTWDGDRIMAVEWALGDDERRIEYEYDGGGNRIAERNYRKGVLERVVRRDGSRELEDLYMNGVLILRAVWEGGRKISEERVRPGASPRQPGPAAGGAE
jgi:hypothetical protein